MGGETTPAAFRSRVRVAPEGRRVAAARGRALLSGIAGGLLLTLAGAAGAADWPQWLGPKRNGTTTEKVAPWEETPKVVWRATANNGFSSPVVSADRVFVHSRGSDKDKEEETVAAFDAATGKELWKDTYARPTYKSVLGTGPRATPTVAGKRLFTLGINGVLSCYEVEKGKRLWQVDLYKHFGADLPASPSAAPRW